MCKSTSNTSQSSDMSLDEFVQKVYESMRDMPDLHDLVESSPFLKACIGAFPKDYDPEDEV